MFAPANATAIATGGFNPAAMEALLARHSGGERNAPRMPKLALPVNHRFRAREESHLFYFPLDLGDAEKVAAARVLVELLEDQVEKRLRRIPSSFPVEVRALAQAPFKGVTVSLPDHVSAGTDLSVHVRQEVQALRDGHTTPEQLAAARDDAVLRFREVDARPERLAEEILAGMDSPDWLGPDALVALEHLERQEGAGAAGVAPGAGAVRPPLLLAGGVALGGHRLDRGGGAQVRWPPVLARGASLAGLLALSAQAAPPPTPVPELLEDGTELVVVLLPAARWSSLRLVVRAGSAQDPDGKGGVAWLLGRSIVDGVADEHGTHLEELVRREGGTLALYSTPTSTTYALDAPSPKFLALAAAVVAHVTSPRLSLVDLQKEVPLLNTESPEPHGPRQPWVRLERLLFPPVNPNQPANGTPVSRQHVERDDLVNFIGKNYLTTAVTAVFAGAVTWEQMRTLVDQNMRLPPAIPDDRPTPQKLDPVSLPLTEKGSGPLSFAAVGYKLEKGRRRACQTLARAADVKVAVALGKAGKAPWMEVRCLNLRGQDFLVASSPARSPDPYAFPDTVDRALKDAAKAQPRGTGWIRLLQGAQRSLELLAEDPPAMADALAREAAVARPAGTLTDVSAVFFKPSPAWAEVKDMAKRSFREDRMFQVYLSPPPPGEK